MENCPKCGSTEISAMTPRTTYECGSSDYDQRPGTFEQSEKCKSLSTPVPTNAKAMKSGIELIAQERMEQVEKHGRTIHLDVIENSHRELRYGAVALLSDDLRQMPLAWDESICLKMINKPYKERLIIAGALIAAEIDRLNANGE